MKRVLKFHGAQLSLLVSKVTCRKVQATYSHFTLINIGNLDYQWEKTLINSNYTWLPVNVKSYLMAIGLRELNDFEVTLNYMDVASLN